MTPQFEQDCLARKKALDPYQSFIVQAPAGSGKTELLVRRYLILLTKVQFPEAILAITFTRKAAAEMRLRILSALEIGGNPPISAAELERWQLAKKVLDHDQAMNWNLLANPNRLRIQTIDSFCQTLSRQMPLLSHFCEYYSPLENPELLYRLAAQELMASLETDSPWQKALFHLLKHLDNDFNRLEVFLSELLASREHWLIYLSYPSRDLRAKLAKSLHAINQKIITVIKHIIPKELLCELTTLLTFSLRQRGENVFHDIENRNFWLAMSQLLLTENNTWRKQLSQKQGFPSSAKTKAQKNEFSAMKHRAMDIIAHLQNEPGLREALIALKNSPPLVYTDTQWQTLAALFELLPGLAAHLKLLFHHYQKVDYIEILLNALTSLGTEEKPTDLALHLDYQIQHILMDEFQDTSISQLQLIEKLTRGWQMGDGRSLFLVGDPMQSIYRFRKAEVSLFLKVKEEGIGNIQLQYLTLSLNFRSHPDIIAWINTCFSKMLPKDENMDQGAIAFSPATVFTESKDTQMEASTTIEHEKSPYDSLQMYWFEEMQAENETQKIVEIIHHIKQHDPTASIAILVRARTHLVSLLPALQQANIQYYAIEIESLAEKSVIQDLLALTRAMLHLGDRTGWLALLHSPFCGLDLSDLHEIVQFANHTLPIANLWQQLTYFEQIGLKSATKQRLRRIVPILQQGLAERGRLPFADLIKKTWLLLGGPTTLNSVQEMAYVQSYLNYLAEQIILEGENQFDIYQFAEGLKKIVTKNPMPLSDHVQIMTIHKAKGLEFDHVILPSLHRKGGHDGVKLMLYQEWFISSQKKDFLLAPIKASDEIADPIYNYLLFVEKQKAYYELTRLLYVACTRAKKSLSLLGIIARDEKNTTKPPQADSLLYHLWESIQPTLEFTFLNSVKTEKNNITNPRLLKRLIANWQNPIAEHLILKTVPYSQFTYHFTPSTARTIGIVVHRLLYQISQDGLEYWDEIDWEKEHGRFVSLLKQENIVSSELHAALGKLKQILKKVLADSKGRWILQQHADAHSELALTFANNGTLHNLIIDRTFLDASGKHWIIDYKTSFYAGTDVNLFLKLARQQHQTQLEAYATALASTAPMKKNNIYCGLYFPLNSLWCEWKFIPQKTPSIRQYLLRSQNKIILDSLND
jgi:ATP-dependent helicase/nuclease subunit A